MAWWLYDLKYTDPNETLFLDVDHLKEYKQFSSIWAWRKRQGVNVYLYLYTFMHSLCTRDLELEWMLEETLASGDLAYEKVMGTKSFESLKERSEGLRVLMGKYLGNAKCP